MKDRGSGKPASVIRLRSPGWQVALWVVAALLSTVGAYKIARGIEHAWSRQGDVDLGARSAEYAWFREGAYPAANLDRPEDAVRPVYSPYPPYAFPMMAPFFEPGGMQQARIVLEAASLAALGVLCAGAVHVLRPVAGPGGAAFGVSVVIAFAGNKNAFDLGQFSIICVGLIVLQMWFIRRNRPILAGTCWAMAMLKPQIALPFGLLFLLPGRAAGLLVGASILGALSMFACAWTDVSAMEVIDLWSGGMRFSFTERVSTGPGPIAAALGADHRDVQYILLASLLGVTVPLVVMLRRIGALAVLEVAALCGGLGMLAFYHAYYDLIMLFPTVLAVVFTACRSGGRIIGGAALALLATVLLPVSLFPGESWQLSMFHAVRAAVWAACAFIPVLVVMADHRRLRQVTP